MLDKLLANLKQSLPEPLRKKLGGEEQSSDDEASEHSEEQSEESHDTSDNEGSAPDDKRKKQLSMLIRVVVVVGLGYLALTEFVFKDQSVEEVPEIAVKPRKPRKKVPPVAPETKPAEVKPEEVKPEETKIAEAAVPADVAPEVQPPVENINIAEKKVEDVQAPPATETAVEKPIDNAPVVKTPEADPSVAQMGEVKTPEAQVEKSLDNLIDSIDKSTETEEGSKKESSMEDKIVADDIYTPPPAYDQMGRGLVYNCKEKYWACVDKMAYVACNKNMKWNQAHGKTIECSVQNVYNSDDDCGVVQKFNVSTSKPTTFCK